MVTKAVLGFAVAVIGLLVVARARDGLREAGSLWALALGRQLVSMVMFFALGPFVLALVLAGALFVLGAPAIASVLVGLFAFVVVRLAVIGARRGFSKAVDRRRRSEAALPSRAYVSGYVVEDADDRPIWVVRVGSGTLLAHRDPVALAGVVADALEPYFAENELPTTVSQHYWENVEHGLVGRAHAESFVRNEAKRSIRGYLERADENRLRYEQLLEKLEDEDVFDHVTEMFDVTEPLWSDAVPRPEASSVVDEMLWYLEARAGELDRRMDGELLVLRR